MQALQNEDVRVEVFISDDKWNIWHIWQVAPNANWIGEWSSLGRPIADQSSNDDYSFAVSLNDGGAIVVLMKDESTGGVFSRSQIEPNGSWELIWTSLGLVDGDFAIAAPPKSLFTQVVGTDVESSSNPGV